MAGLEELKKKLVPLFDAEKGFPSGSTIDPSDSYMLSDGGTVNLLSKSYNIYNINELGLQNVAHLLFLRMMVRKRTDSGQISIALEYMDGGSLADIIRVRKSIPEPILSVMVQKLLLMLTIHYYLLFDGSDDLWHHMKTLYEEYSVFSFGGKESFGPNDIFTTLSNIRRTLAGEWPPEKLVHVVEKLQCRAHGQNGIAIRVSGSFIVGNQFLICGDGVQVEGLPNFRDLSIDIPSKRMGTFREQFIVETSNVIGRYFIVKQELYIVQ
ncbi:UNVERIFIED_CONTAM: Mitogen-activated protein kinase kinase [Sesamum radiatum]|uniref:Mitogen-activated protein kinase kinase n=1 Tax=Sesamum radiatum TaxID=300843 RepID=A0AAW2PLT5_SESRA